MRAGGIIKGVIRAAGIDIRHFRPAAARRAALIRRHEIRSVIDGGANTGQYATEIRDAGFSGHIISIEPLLQAFSKLQCRAANDACWQALNCALSDAEDPSATIHIAANSASSSLLQMNDLHSSVAPHAPVIGTQVVRLRRLDAIEEARALPAPILLKLDVQGYELAALRGASEMLDLVHLIECETSIRPLYAGQPLLPDVLQELEALGYALLALEPGFYDPQSGEILQFDAFFEQRGSRPRRAEAGTL